MAPNTDKPLEVQLAESQEKVGVLEVQLIESQDKVEALEAQLTTSQDKVKSLSVKPADPKQGGTAPIGNLEKTLTDTISKLDISSVLIRGKHVEKKGFKLHSNVLMADKNNQTGDNLAGKLEALINKSSARIKEITVRAAQVKGQLRTRINIVPEKTG